MHARGYYVHAGGTLALLVQVRRSSGTGNIVPPGGAATYSIGFDCDGVVS